MSPECKSFASFFTAFVFYTSTFATGYAQTLPYQPTAIEGASWVVYDNMGLYSPFDSPSSYVVVIRGDSTIADIDYKKVYVGNLTHDIITPPDDINPPYTVDAYRFYGLIRDDLEMRSVFGRVPNQSTGIISDDTLLHNYAAGIGDSLRGFFKEEVTAVIDTFALESYGVRRQVQRSLTNRVFVEGIGSGQHSPLGYDPVLYINEGRRALLAYCVGTAEECGLKIISSTRPVLRDPSMLLYPNPVRNAFKVDLLEPLFYWTHYRIYDPQGRLLYQKVLNPNQVISVSGLSAGVYGLQLSRGNEISTIKRFVKF